ncbi:glycosyltransferase [Singulisphaera acidiphila]|uniref:Glycosyltransferase n=1 Tax=Singulisphaera acidiphila (strain ATCC BAA-1392 / DSM 18658 / VKM B-2454 / MOB10) TaxID=886293 RepID=L0D5V9_SINAD|nr:glycosyltransferase [Singulisphaera acidiphila]AGA24799.1 glycosyltransferase [Singulisphaera acidiphila DSM 18658]
MSLKRLLFASIHGYIDPSSGAAWASRDVLELMAARGVECRAISAGLLSYEREMSVEEILKPLGVPIRKAAPMAGMYPADSLEFDLGGVGVTLVPTASSQAERFVDPSEMNGFLARTARLIDEFRPQVMLTYGGHPASFALMKLARSRDVPVVFHLHNLAYPSRSTFDHATAILVPSEYCRRHYLQQLALESTAIPSPLIPERMVAPVRDPRYVTFINPQLSKGAAVVARIAVELHNRRPEIPLLIVEGRGAADALKAVRLDLSELRNLNRLPNLPNPRAIYRLSRMLLVPSLVRETFGRVAAEGLANGIPVLASDRGALPETLGDAGFVFTLPGRCTPQSVEAPTAHEVAPWVATIERLWDDSAWEVAHQERASVESRRWDPDLVADRYLSFFNAHGRRD